MISCYKKLFYIYCCGIEVNFKHFRLQQKSALKSSASTIQNKQVSVITLMTADLTTGTFITTLCKPLQP